MTISGTDGSNYTLQANGGTQAVSPTVTTTYTATATGAGGKASASATVTVTPAPDGQHHRQPHIDCVRQFLHLDGDGGQRHSGDD